MSSIGYHEFYHDAHELYEYQWIDGLSLVC